MLVQEEREDVYFNFVNSIDSEVTRKTYEYLMSKFLKYCNLDLGSLLRLSQRLDNQKRVSSTRRICMIGTLMATIEIPNNPIFYGKNTQVLVKPVKLDKIEKSMLDLVNKN